MREALEVRKLETFKATPPFTGREAGSNKDNANESHIHSFLIRFEEIGGVLKVNAAKALPVSSYSVADSRSRITV